VTYTIRPGDTLFSLANKTNTTIEEIMQANCLDSNLIIAGEPLSLPSLPPAPSPLPTRHLPSPTSICDVPFVCSTPGPALVLATGGGNDPNFTPCEFHLQSAWLDKDVPAAQAVQLQIGQHLFVYACDFPAEVISATITSSDGSPNSAPIYTVHPNPDLKMGNASAVIDWAALPTHPTGKYILEASDKDNNLASLEFTVTAPSEPFILVVPSTGAPGDNFQVYYIHFPLNTNPTFQLFGEDQPVVGQPHTLSLRSQWQVFINQPFVPPSAFGWAVASLEMPAQLSPAAYTITLEDQSILFTFWLR
jgi:LysM repeat protein